MTNEPIPGHDSPVTTESANAATAAPQNSQHALLRWVQHHNAPYVFGAAVLAIAALFAVGTSTGVSLPSLTGSPRVVVFDPVKFTNAQRAAASLLVASPNADLTLTMTQVAKHAEAVIREEAGDALVLVKQAVVAPEGMVDITDRVIERFGLPSNVPTITTSPNTLDSLTPTDHAFTKEQLREDYRTELQGRSMRMAEEQQKQSRQDSILP